MRFYCEWPARVMGINIGQIDVEFFGDNTSHKTAFRNIFNFVDSSDVIIANLRGRKNPLLLKSVQEAEIVLGIPQSHSITNKIVS